MTRSQLIDRVYNRLTDSSFPEAEVEWAFTMIQKHNITSEELNDHGTEIYAGKSRFVRESD